MPQVIVIDEIGTELVNDDDLGHVVLDRLDHHLMLKRRGSGPASGGPCRSPGGGCRRRPRSRSRCRPPNNRLPRSRARGLAEHRGLADPRPAHDEDALPRLDEVLGEIDRAEDGLADPTGGPTTFALRLRIAEMRWSVGSMPGRVRRRSCRCGRRRGRCRPRSPRGPARSPRCSGTAAPAAAEVEHDLDERGDLSGRAWTATTTSWGAARREQVQVVHRLAVAVDGCTSGAGWGSSDGRHGAGSATRTRVSFIAASRWDRVEAVVLQCADRPDDSYVRTGAMTPWSWRWSTDPSACARRSRPARTG